MRNRRITICLCGLLLFTAMSGNTADAHNASVPQVIEVLSGDFSKTVTLTGTVEAVSCIQESNGERITSKVLVLDQPVNIVNAPGAMPSQESRIQCSAVKDSDVGKKVEITGRLLEGLTAWYCERYAFHEIDQVKPVQSEVKVILDGEALSFDQPPIVESGRTLVPLRAIFEAMGAKVDWDQKTQTVTASKGTDTVQLSIGKTTAYKNNKAIALDVPAKVANGRTLVPVRFIAESFGADVNWNGETRTVTILGTSDSAAGNGGSSQTASKSHRLEVETAKSVVVPNGGEMDQLFYGCDWDLKFPKVKDGVPGAEQMNEEINVKLQSYTKFLEEAVNGREVPSNYTYWRMEYETHRSGGLCALEICQGSGNVAGSGLSEFYYFVYYDEDNGKPISAEEYAQHFGYSKQQIVDLFNSQIILDGVEDEIDRTTDFSKVKFYMDENGLPKILIDMIW